LNKVGPILAMVHEQCDDMKIAVNALLKVVANSTMTLDIKHY